MSALVSFDLYFPVDVSPISLLLRCLQAGFNDFLRPKMGWIKTDDAVLEFGPRPPTQIYETTALVEGEQMVAPNITALTQHSDATEEITPFLAQLSTCTWFFAELVGDYRVDYPRGANIVEGWPFRYGNDTWRQPIVRCVVRDYAHSRMPSDSGVLLVVPCPWFFLKDWLLEIGPRYSTPETAERNWNRLIDLVRLTIDVAGEDKLEELCLNIEGWGPRQEKEWLIERAQQRLPNLTVHLS